MASKIKAAKIASAVESDILKRMSSVQSFYYKDQFAWGTEVGNHIFDTVAERSRAERLSEADDYALSLLYMLLQAQADDSEGGVAMFKEIFREVWPHISNAVSVAVASEIAMSVDING